MEEQLHPIISRLRMVLGEFLGVEAAAAQPPTPSPAEAPRILVTEEFAPTPAPRPGVTLSERELLFMLLTEIARGIRLRGYRTHKFTVAPSPITFEGSQYDLGEEYDTVLIVPTIDAQIEIDKPVEVSTPIIKANTCLNLDSVKVKVIYYKGVTPGLTGDLSVWAFKY
jgi:hypothetical protein